MKIAIVLCAVLALALSKPLDDSQSAKTIHESNDNIGVGGYLYDFETSNGIRRREEAVVKNPGTDNEFLSITGEVAYIDKDGTPIFFKYTADDNGYHAEGDHIPKA